MKCTHIVATTAYRSLRKVFQPGDIVLPEQFIDFTKRRHLTFHDKKVIHTSIFDPLCGYLRGLIGRKTKELDTRCHGRATVVTIVGPKSSTRVKSKMFRLLGADIINMSFVSEVILVKEYSKNCL